VRRARGRREVLNDSTLLVKPFGNESVKSTLRVNELLPHEWRTPCVVPSQWDMTRYGVPTATDIQCVMTDAL
jgi:hypothetical protein